MELFCLLLNITNKRKINQGVNEQYPTIFSSTMDSLPIEILEQILTYKNISLADVSNVLQTCKYLRTTIQENNFIWRHVFTQRWPDLQSKINPEEVTDWFDEARNVTNLMSHLIDICAHMASRFILVDTLFPRDFSELNKLVKSRKFNDIYIDKHLSFLKTDVCDINSIKAVPCTTTGNLTLRYYADLAHHHLHQEKCLEEFTKYLKIPEKFRTLERWSAIISRLIHPFDDIKYENIREELDRHSIEAQNELRKLNPLHPLFAISQDVQSSWKYQTLRGNIFKRSHLLEILRAVNTILYVKYGFDPMDTNKENYHDDDRLFTNKMLSTGPSRAVRHTQLSIIYESICRRLGVHCQHLESPQHIHSFNLRTVCSGSASLTFYIDPSSLEYCSERQVKKHISSAYRATSHDVMLSMLNKLREYFSDPENKSMLKFIQRFIIELYPELKVNFIIYSSYFRETKNMYSWRFSDRDEENTFECFETELFASCRSHEMAKKYFHDQPKPRDEPIFPIGSIVVFNRHFSNRGVIVGSTPYFLEDKYWDDNILLLSGPAKYASQTSKTFYFVIDAQGQRYYISKDKLEFDENPSPLPDCLLYIGKYFSHFFVNHYVPNEHTNKVYPNDEKYRLAHYQQLLFKKQTF